MNELPDEERFYVVEEVGISNLVFDQRLETYCGGKVKSGTKKLEDSFTNHK